MLRSIKQLYGIKLGASDGEIGHVKDFYFDDRKWAIRYLIVDTGVWLPGRQVLLSPHSITSLDQPEMILGVNLTRKQIQDSPSIESHKPVSRQYEEEYYRYYGWPYYWQGDGLWGMGGFPILELPPKPLANDPASPDVEQTSQEDAHLLSAQAVNGYHLRTEDGTIGHLCDYMMDPHSWEIVQLVIRTGHRLSGKEVLIATKKVIRISYEESTVFVDLTSEAVERSPAHHLTQAAAVD